MTLVVIALLWIVPIFVGLSIGRAKSRAGWAYGLLLGWIGVLILALLPRRVMWRCPHCREAIQQGATRCPHCQGPILVST